MPVTEKVGELIRDAVRKIDAAQDSLREAYLALPSTLAKERALILAARDSIGDAEDLLTDERLDD